MIYDYKSRQRNEDEVNREAKKIIDALIDGAAQNWIKLKKNNERH